MSSTYLYYIRYRSIRANGTYPQKQLYTFKLGPQEKVTKITLILTQKLALKLDLKGVDFNMGKMTLKHQNKLNIR